MTEGNCCDEGSGVEDDEWEEVAVELMLCNGLESEAADRQRNTLDASLTQVACPMLEYAQNM
jgi:hypothetical protein